MGNTTDNLIKLLSDCISLLKKYNSEWANWFSVAKSSLEQSDFSGIRKILEAYGGMGSFNDMVLFDDKNNDQCVDDNNLLSNYRTEIYKIAEEIKRDYEISK